MEQHTFKVQWEEQSNSSTRPARKATTVQAANMFEAEAKVRARINVSVQVSNMVAFQIR